MFKKLALIVLWFLFAPLVIGTCSYLASQRNIKISNIQPIVLTSTALPFLTPPIRNNIDSEVLGVQIVDMRPYYVENFLKKTNLASYSLLMVQVADKYGIDYRLIPAIAMKESGGGNKARAGSFNAWGFENGRTNFGSWEEAINNVGKTLKERYIAKGLITPDEIMPVYAPPQLLTGGKWAKDVNYFFSKMEQL